MKCGNIKGKKSLEFSSENCWIYVHTTGKKKQQIHPAGKNLPVA